MSSHGPQSRTLHDLVETARPFVGHPEARAELERAFREIDAELGRIVAELACVEAAQWPKSSGPRVKGYVAQYMRETPPVSSRTSRSSSPCSRPAFVV